MPVEPQNLLWIAGRTLFGVLFAQAGIRHFFHFSFLTQRMARRGVPAPAVVLVFGAALQTAAGAAVIAGFQLVWAAAALIVFTLVASVMFLNFWSMEGAERTSASNAFWSNIGIIGGLLVIAAYASSTGVR